MRYRTFTFVKTAQENTNKSTRYKTIRTGASSFARKNTGGEKMSLTLKKAFEVRLTNVESTVCGQDYDHNGRRQLVYCPEGEITGPDFHGHIMPAGIDHQIIRSDGSCEASVAYGFQLDDGRSIYITAQGVRRVPEELAEKVKNGEPVDPKQFYFVTVPKFEVYDDSLRWLSEKIFVCDGTRLPDSVLLTYYSVEQTNDHPALG